MLRSILTTVVLSVCSLIMVQSVHAADVFTLKSELENEHPRILFTQVEADARLAVVSSQASGKIYIDYVKARMNTLQYKFIAKNAWPSHWEHEYFGQYVWWNLTRAAIVAALTRETAYIDIVKEWLTGLNVYYDTDWWGLPDAGNTVGLGTAHLVGAYALAYDCIYNDLTDAERTACESRLLQAMQIFSTRGFESGVTGAPGYWINDYQNNHMHFRMTAQLFNVIAVWGETATDISAFADNVVKYFRRTDYALAPDGTSHEGFQYNNYGHALLTPALAAYERCLTGAPELHSSSYHNSGYAALYLMTSDMSSTHGYGDGGNGPGNSLAWLYYEADVYDDPYIQKFITDVRAKNAGMFERTQWPMLFWDINQAEWDYSSLPKHRFFDDLGFVTCRNSWTDATATSILFKCGPMGGKRLNDTRGTEYSCNTDYINVAHDDPDAGHFVLYNNGSFLSVGNDYEKYAKITDHHSTMQVDGVTQYGGGGGWSAPKPVSQWAWPKNFSTGGEMVVYTGDMKGVYPSMDKLDRTMVSSNADYIVIFDQMESSTSGRTFDWRWAAPDAATLTDKGSNTYEVANGNGKAQVKMYEPSAASWATGTFTVNNGAGNRKLLHASLTGQQDQNFLAVIAPGADDMSFVTANYNSGGTYGIKAAKDGNTEYVLFGTAGSISAGDVTASADVVATTGSATRLANAAMTNGTALAYNGTDYVSSTAKVNVGIDSLKADGTQALYRITAGSGAGGATATITLGGLAASTSMELSINGVAQSNVTTNGSGEADVSVSLDTVQVVALGGVEPFNSVRMPAVDGMPGLTIAPQPLVTGGQVSLHAATGMRVNAVLYNTDGTVSATLYNGLLPAGQTGVKVNVAPGMYLLNVNGYVSRVMVVK